MKNLLLLFAVAVLFGCSKENNTFGCWKYEKYLYDIPTGKITKNIGFQIHAGETWGQLMDGFRAEGAVTKLKDDMYLITLSETPDTGYLIQDIEFMEGCSGSWDW